MPAAPELQARLAWRLLVTETSPPPIQVDDDQSVSSPVRRRLPSPSNGASHEQHGSASEESKVQLTDAYSARCQWRPKHCGECDKLRLLNSRLVGRLQAAEAHIKILTRDHSATLEDLSSRFMSEGESHKLLETKLADLQPYMEILEGITAEVNKRLEVSVGLPSLAGAPFGTSIGTTAMTTPAASIAWIGDDASSTPVKVDMTPAALAASSRSSPEESPLEGYYSKELERSQRSLEDALLKSLKATTEAGKAASPRNPRARPMTPDWPHHRQLQASSSNVATSVDARKACSRPGNSCGTRSCGPRQKLLPGKVRVEPGSHGRPPVPLPSRGSSRPRQGAERRMSPC